ncbi:putative membrane protein [Oopsacas minuta]|uniref:Membrane protein n=1 Tax=Oopsacas minuta TaxID=111878 RepID=A0AAV7JTP5_9METZ|nr:putative membrane protein [Oopsacas minuta]
MILSTLRPLFAYYDTNCKDVLHPHTDSCVQAFLDIVFTVSKQSLKLYLVLYLFLRLIQWKLSLKPYLIDVFRSSLFLVINGPGLLLADCVFDKIFGVMYKFNSIFVPGLIAAASAFLVESRSRQRLLAPYIFSNCVDSVSSVFVSRNFLPSIPYLDVLLFMLASGKICGRLSTPVSHRGFNDTIFSLLTNPIDILRRNFFPFYQILSFYLHKFLPNSNILKIPILLTGGCVWGLLIGLSYNIVTLIISKVSKLLSGSKEERRSKRFNFHIPILLAAYIGLFQICKHILRNVTPLSDTISGLLAGSAISIYRFPSLSLYFFIKELLSLSKTLMHSGYLPRIPYFNFFLYFISCAIQFHCVVFEPENVILSYRKFINTVSGGLVLQISNSLKEKECISY